MAKKVVSHEISLEIDSEVRHEVRTQVIQTWLREIPGTMDVTHRYRYNVERIRDGSRVYLTRPARLNRGIDFVIYCENFTRWKNQKDKPPTHDVLCAEIDDIARRSMGHRLELRRALGRIWACERPDAVLAGLRLLANDVESERVLKLARWMFIEQDLTYWTESGRWMLRGGIEKRIGSLG